MHDEKFGTYTLNGEKKDVLLQKKSIFEICWMKLELNCPHVVLYRFNLNTIIVLECEILKFS